MEVAWASVARFAKFRVPSRIATCLAGEDADVITALVDWGGCVTVGTASGKIRRYSSNALELVHSPRVEALAVREGDGKLVSGSLISGSSSGTVKFWRKSGKCFRTVESAYCVSFLISPSDGSVAFASRDSKRINVVSGRRSCTVKMNHRPRVTSLVSLPENRLASSSEKSIKVWSVDGSCLRTMVVSATRALAALPDGTVVSCHWGDIRIWGPVLETLEAETNATGLVVFPNGVIVVPSYRQLTFVQHLWQRHIIKTCRNYYGAIRMQDGTLACWSIGGVHIWA